MEAARLKYRRIIICLGRYVPKPLALAILFPLIIVSFPNLLPALEGKTANGINCDIQHHACTKQVSGCLVTLDITPKPVKAMTDLLFRITLSGKTPGASPHIDLGMPGMDMGPNRVKLKPVGKGTYEGTGVIVRCPSGRKIWGAKVTIPGAGVTEFIFNVVY